MRPTGMAAVAAISIASFTSLAQEAEPILTLASARAIADGCEAFATENGLKVTMTIMDHHGNIKLVRRMDGSRQATLVISEMKARTPATLQATSKRLGEAVAERVPGIAHVPGLASWEGGVPIYMADGTHLGGIGVSGASSADDARCGTAGVESVPGLSIARPAN